MNKYLRAAIASANGIIKTGSLKLFYKKRLDSKMLCVISPLTEITLDKGSFSSIGKRFTMRGGSKIRVRNKANLKIGDSVYVNHNCIVVCREKIQIGNNVQFSPNVQIYDHDHDYKVGLSKQKFITAPIVIGNNVWIGSNSILLKGITVGNNCVIAAGSIITKDIPDNTVVIQKRKLK